MKLKSLLTRLFIKLREHTYKKQLKYLFFRKHSDTLVIVFSGMSKIPVYNYVRTLRTLKIDRLYLLDDFGYCGSYHWFSKGMDIPLMLTKNLIDQVINQGGYKRVITIGSSKGGTDAIYFGLQCGAQHIFAGAPQYYVGTYLTDGNGNKIQPFYSMMGEEAGESERKKLDDMMSNCLNECLQNRVVVHLLYSKNEHTYDDDVQYLLRDLDTFGIQHEDKIEEFTDHSDVGKYFSPWILKELGRLT